MVSGSCPRRLAHPRTPERGLNLCWTRRQNPQGPPAWGPCVHPDTSLSPNPAPLVPHRGLSIPNSSAPREDHCWLTGLRRGAWASIAQPVYTVHRTQGTTGPRGREGQGPTLVGVASDPLPPKAWAQHGAPSNPFSAHGVIPLHIPTELIPFLGRTASFQERKSHQTKPNKKCSCVVLHT